MNWFDYAWAMMGATCLVLALIHAFIWLHRKNEFAHAMLAMASLAVAALSVMELQGLRTASPERFATLVRWGHVPLAVVMCLLPWMLHLRFRAGRRWIAWTSVTIRLVCLCLNFLTGVNLNFAEVTAMRSINLLGLDQVYAPVGLPNYWMILAQVSNLLIVVFIVDVGLAVWRRGDPDERRRALWLCGGIAAFMMIAPGVAVLTAFGVLKIPFLVTAAYVAALVGMSYDLGGEVVRSADTARRLVESERLLRVTQQQAATAAGAAGLGLWSWSPGNSRFWISANGRALVGLDDSAGNSWQALMARVHPDDRRALQDDVERCLAGGGTLDREHRVLAADGATRWVSSRGRTEGEPRTLWGVSIDVTARRQAEQYFEIAVEASPSALLMLDASGRILLANRQAEAVFGHTRDEFLRLQVEALIPERLRAAHAGLREGFDRSPATRAMGVGQELYGLRRDGSEVPVEIGLAPIQTANGTLVLAVVTDISERVRAQRDIEQHRAELAHLSRVALLGELSASLAHELNQPLAAVLSNAQAALMLMDREPSDLDEVRECLLDIVENDKRAGDVIRRLRAMLKKQDVEHRLVDLNDVAADMLRLVRNDLLDRNVAVTLELMPDLPAVLGDHVQLQQVVLNLIVNACDAMQGMARGRAIVVRTCLDADGNAEIQVSDVGPGIPEEQMGRIFEPFFTTKSDGMGLGLAICRAIASALGGTLRARNNAGPGASFVLALPVAESM